jgi:hypothetical protein
MFIIDLCIFWMILHQMKISEPKKVKKWSWSRKYHPTQIAEIAAYSENKNGSTKIRFIDDELKSIFVVNKRLLLMN